MRSSRDIPRGLGEGEGEEGGGELKSRDSNQTARGWGGGWGSFGVRKILIDRSQSQGVIASALRMMMLPPWQYTGTLYWREPSSNVNISLRVAEGRSL